jgi:deoxyribodipyrimidine photo-lyase
VFQKFTPFWERVMNTDIRHPQPQIKGPWVSARSIHNIERMIESHSISLDEAKNKFVGRHGLGGGAAQKGGRREGLARLRDLPPKYSDTRDYPSIPSSMLSAHNHFGTVSIREVYWAAVKRYGTAEIRDGGGFIRQLWWRDFNGHLMHAFDDLYRVNPWEFDGPSHLRGKKGEREMRIFKAWCRGETGFDLVDAGMRSLLTTGFIHNRVRMVCASWLVKDMGVWWRLGERWFAKHLVDYDPAQNLMNWIGICSLAPFGAAPFRRHDPERALERFDASREYVDKYLDDENAGDNT